MSHFSSSVRTWLFFAGPATTRSIASSRSSCVIGGRPLPHGEQRRLVDHVRQLGAGEPGRHLRDLLKRGAGGERAVSAVQLQDRLAAVDVGRVDDDLAVEAARPQQRGVEHVRAVGRTHHDDAELGAEAVHLDEDLVERLLALVVALAHAGAALAPGGVELVDEDDRRRHLARLRNRSRTRAAPTPTSDSTNSEPESEKKAAAASPAVARASSVLPVPGGPTSSTPFGACAPMRVVLASGPRGSRRSPAAPRPPLRRRRRRRTSCGVPLRPCRRTSRRRRTRPPAVLADR